MSRTTDAKSKSDTSGIHLWLVLWKAFRSVEAHALQDIAAHRLGLSDFGVLEVLLHKGPLTVKELGAKVMLTSGSMTAAIDRLEKRGLVERSGHKDDRRIRMICLTKTGEAFIRDVFEDHKQAMEDAVAGIEKNDREILIPMLRQLGMQAAQQLTSSRRKHTAVRSGGKAIKR
ncbi:MAG TPA: MarR family transcriptional regulator [Alloacidobacterium sp.]|nr:MarR family transcriptional regulator [Alloacidobacterium sp.]